MSTGAQWLAYGVLGAGLWGGFLYGLHLLFTHRQRSISASATPFRARLERYVTRRGALS